MASNPPPASDAPALPPLYRSECVAEDLEPEATSTGGGTVAAGLWSSLGLMTALRSGAVHQARGQAAWPALVRQHP
jgi:hypothetical protein